MEFLEESQRFAEGTAVFRNAIKSKATPVLSFYTTGLVVAPGRRLCCSPEANATF